MVGRRWAEYSHPDDVALEGAVLTRLAAGVDTYADERRYLRPDGSTVWAALHLTLVRDEAGGPQYYLAQLQDICERKQMERFKEWEPVPCPARSAYPAALPSS